jgi:trimeric autotransporter adhesin
VFLLKKKEFLIFVVIVSLLLVLFVFAAPSLTTVTLNASSTSNNTYDNLTVHTDQDDNTSVKLIYNWDKDGTAIAVLNMPFEGGSLNGTGGGQANAAKDYSGNEDNGTAYNVLWSSTSGYDGWGAYEFDGTTDYITGDDSGFPLGASPRTMSAWIKWDGTTGRRMFMGYGQNGIGQAYGYRIGNTGVGKVEFIGYGRGDGTTLFTLPANEWTLLTSTYDGSDVRTYVNGTLVSTQTLTLDTTSSSGYRIGWGYDNNANTFSGFMDEFMVYNRALSAEQIMELYNNRTDMIVSDDTSFGDVWNVTVTPNDGIEDGNILSGDGITIINNAPTHTTPVLSSSLGTNTYLENLTVENQTTADSEGDNVKNIFNWYKDGTSIMVLNMPFESDSNSNHAKDYSPYSKNGTITNALWSSTGGYDGWGAYEFDGSTDYITVDDSSFPLGASSRTMSAWIKWDGTTGRRMVIGYGKSANTQAYGYRLGLQGVGEVEFVGYNAGDGTTLFTLPANEWTLLTSTYDGSDVRTYVNGTLITTKTLSLNTVSSSGFRIGWGYDGNAVTFPGFIDDVSVYNRALSAEQIMELYNNRTDLMVSDEIAIDDVWNATVTPNDGSIDGTTLWSNTMTILEEAEEPEAEPFPEFSDYAIALLLLTVVGGFFIMRKRNA